jgi:capsular polysaccharide biosynthesis protein
MDFESTNFILYLYKRRKPIILITLIAGIMGAIFSSPFFIPPKFRSVVVLFPATTNSVSQALITEKTAYTKDIMEFGKEEEAEQMLQLLYSDDIRSQIIQEFNLMEHYEIEEKNKYKMTALHEEYNSNISFRRTQYMSVEISVLDTDPQIAADIANRIADLVDSTKTVIQQERAKQGFQIVEKEYLAMQEEIKIMEDSLKTLRKMGIHDYEVQTAVLSEQYAQAVIENKSGLAQELKEQLDLLAEYGGAYVSVRDNLRHRYETMNDLKLRYDAAKVDAEQSLSQKFVVNKAFPAEKKTYPVRWLIVALSMMGAALFTLLAYIVLDTVQKASRK